MYFRPEVTTEFDNVCRVFVYLASHQKELPVYEWVDEPLIHLEREVIDLYAKAALKNKQVHTACIS
jgi:hypothetical protein